MGVGHIVLIYAVYKLHCGFYKFIARVRLKVRFGARVRIRDFPLCKMRNPIYG